MSRILTVTDVLDHCLDAFLDRGDAAPEAQAE